MLTKQQMWDIAFKTLGGEWENYRQEKLVIVMEDSGDVEALYEALKEGERLDSNKLLVP